MPLNWNVKDVYNFEEVCYKDDVANPGECEVSHITRKIIFRTMDVGINKITENNYQEFWRRCKAIQELEGPDFINAKGELFGLTEQDIKNHIGLGTNASPINKFSFDARIRKLVAKKAS